MSNTFKINRLFAIIASLVIFQANSASFDCTKATTSVEKMICSNSELSNLDIELSEVYRNAKHKKLAGNEQREWLKERNRCASKDCLLAIYKDRILELEDLIVRYDRRRLNEGRIDEEIYDADNKNKTTLNILTSSNDGLYYYDDPSIAKGTRESIHESKSFFAEYAKLHSPISLGKCMGFMAIIDKEKEKLNRLFASVFSLLDYANGNLLTRYSAIGKRNEVIQAAQSELPKLTNNLEYRTKVGEECLNTLNIAVSNSGLKLK
jgi:hypothetical protein